MSRSWAVTLGEEVELKRSGSENFCLLFGDFVTHVTLPSLSIPVAAQRKQSLISWFPAAGFCPQSDPESSTQLQEASVGAACSRVKPKPGFPLFSAATPRPGRCPWAGSGRGRAPRGRARSAPPGGAVGSRFPSAQWRGSASGSQRGLNPFSP